jgi:dihydroorotate dehydrogenase electron transfer subunit
VLKQITSPIISNIQLLPGIHQLIVEAPDIALSSQPGQFLMVNCGHKLLLNRPLSIHRIKNSSKISLLYSIVGRGTLYLSQRMKDEYVRLIGPLGNGFSIDDGSEHLLLIAGGIGIAPLVFLADKAISLGKSVCMLLGTSTSSQLYPRHLLPDVNELAVATEDGSFGVKGLVTDILYDYVENSDQIFACGPAAMYKTIYDMDKLGQLKERIQVSLEVRMGCGTGICYGCSIKTVNGMQTVCHDGPVFSMDEVLWEEVNYDSSK